MTAAPAQLREDNRYQQMRSEINRRQSPFSGGTDWEKVYDLAATLAMTDGVDLLAASYFSVAAAKTRGIAGLASGLELLLTVLAHSKEMGTISPEKCAEILNWAIGKLLPELKDMQATEGNIREWYRCEYACQQLFELMQRVNPSRCQTWMRSAFKSSTRLMALNNRPSDPLLPQVLSSRLIPRG